MNQVKKKQEDANSDNNEDLSESLIEQVESGDDTDNEEEEVKSPAPTSTQENCRGMKMINKDIECEHVYTKKRSNSCAEEDESCLDSEETKKRLKKLKRLRSQLSYDYNGEPALWGKGALPPN